MDVSSSTGMYGDTQCQHAVFVMESDNGITTPLCGNNKGYHSEYQLFILQSKNLYLIDLYPHKSNRMSLWSVCLWCWIFLIATPIRFSFMKSPLQKYGSVCTLDWVVHFMVASYMSLDGLGYIIIRFKYLIYAIFYLSFI